MIRKWIYFNFLVLCCYRAKENLKTHIYFTKLPPTLDIDFIWIDLDFSGIILESRRHRECIPRKNDHGEPSSMIIPDNHKMAQNVSDSPFP